jgi:hypothetical protein
VNSNKRNVKHNRVEASNVTAAAGQLVTSYPGGLRAGDKKETKLNRIEASGSGSPTCWLYSSENSTTCGLGEERSRSSSFLAS